MRRSTLFLMLGLFCTAIFIAAISVYIFHDVDHDKIGHWNAAFAGLCIEVILFTLIIGVPVWLLTLCGQHIFHLTGYASRAMFSFLLGIGVTVLQYPWEFAARKELPKFADSCLLIYLILAIILCTVVLLRDNFSQMKLHEALKGSSPVTSNSDS